MLKYKRISLKLSGEALGGGHETVDFAKVEAVAAQLAALHALGAPFSDHPATLSGK